MNDELLKIVDWLTANKLSLNVKKTNYIIFHPYQKHLNYDVNIKILDNRVNKYFNLERKEYVKYLGVMIDNHLSRKHHINYVALKISRNIGILSKLRHFIPPKTLFGIYNSLILPIFLIASLPGDRLQKLIWRNSSDFKKELCA